MREVNFIKAFEESFFLEVLICIVFAFEDQASKLTQYIYIYTGVQLCVCVPPFGLLSKGLRMLWKGCEYQMHTYKIHILAGIFYASEGLDRQIPSNNSSSDRSQILFQKVD